MQRGGGGGGSGSGGDGGDKARMRRWRGGDTGEVDMETAVHVGTAATVVWVAGWSNTWNTYVQHHC